MSVVLFEDGLWRICRTGLHGANSIIQHRCGPEYNLDDQWWHISAGDYCLYCRVAVPGEILGLHILHNWDWDRP